MPELSVQEGFELAVRQQTAGQVREAERIYQRILAVEPGHLGSLQNAAAIAYQTGRPLVAAELLRRAISVRPDDAGLLSNLGSVLAAATQVEGAIDAFQKAAALKPDAAQIHSNLGNALLAIGRSQEAIEAYSKALALDPGLADAHSNLAVALSALGRRQEAIAEFRRAVALRPRFVHAWNNLGTALREAGELDESIVACEQALAIDPNFLPAHHNLGNTLRDAGELDQAVERYRIASSGGNNPASADDLLLALLLHPNVTARQVWDEHVRWNEVYARPLAPPLLEQNGVERNGDAASSKTSCVPVSLRRLRVGYVSPDFREHPVGRFFLPLIENHDHVGFEIFCYNDSRQSDSLTERMQAKADVSRNVHGLSDEKLAGLVREDQIEILVDLTMHTKNNRLLVFARKPAPVQVTYLAYPGTTGLATMDYRLTDPWLDPSGQEGFYSEKSIWLPRTFWCYGPSQHAPAVGPLPAAASGRVTFGCLNLYSKVTAVMLANWARILRQVPNSRLIVHSFRGSHRERAWDIFGAEGVERERVEFVDRVLPAEYFARYQQIDIALDTHPYPGGTTTCDALWMGVPVATMAGRTTLSRGGVSILSNVGISELIARDSEQYVQIATRLAGDLPRLSALRAGLRDRVLASPLMNAPAFARDVESAYRRMWAEGRTDW
jgi:predicted O-linked N-acetylglucosamine transferase (SPINDLY family)